MPPTPHAAHPPSPAPAPAAAPSDSVGLSVIAPAHNEEENVVALADQVAAGARATGLAFEFILVDDGSTDQTRARAIQAAATRPWMRVIAMATTPTGKGNGQSAAFHAGIRASRGELIATIDADLQNDPADLPDLLRVMRQHNADLVQGDRSHARRDNAIRRVTSVIGRLFRRTFLGDTVRDTGCSLRIMRRPYALALPLQFRGIHRFVPVSVANLGGRVVECRVNHRPRVAGQTKYGLGIVQRALPGLMDLLAVRWMASRRRPTDFAGLTDAAASSSPVISTAPATAHAHEAIR